MKKLLLLMMLLPAMVFPQEFKVEYLKGTAKAQIGSSEQWINVIEGQTFKPNTVIATEENSTIKLKKGDVEFTMYEVSAVNLSSLKKLSLDELLLALAMEEILSAPKKKEDVKSKSTVVYGTRETGKQDLFVRSNDFGIKRLNGAVRLTESGFKESAIITARETFRKYPHTKGLVPFRLYFANLLIEKNLYEEALEEYYSIQKLSLNQQQKEELEDKLEFVNRKVVK
jgi:hypothetical protein